MHSMFLKSPEPSEAYRVDDRAWSVWRGCSLLIVALTHLLSASLCCRFDPKHQYKSVSSERLGRSDSYQEQYVFIYR